MTPRILRPSLLPLATALVAAPALAVDIVGDLDLLSSGTPPPNVVILIDNSTSMESTLDGVPKITTAGDAVKTLINELYPDDGAGGYTATVRMGLARFTEGADPLGGTIVEPIADDNKQDLLDATDAIVARTLDPGTPGTYTPLSETLVDITRYYVGDHGFGTFPVMAGTSPIDLACRENFVVIVTDGEPTEDENDIYGDEVAGSAVDLDFWGTIGNADGDFNECNARFDDVPLTDPDLCNDNPISGRDDGNAYANQGTDWLDDVAYHIAHNDLIPEATLTGDQIIKTHTVGFAIDHPLLSETATNGLGDYLTAPNAADLATQLQEAFNNIFDSIQASFTSAVVPGATIGLGNAFYNSYFRSSNDEPVWEGHLEALRISQTGEIQDSNLDPVVDPGTGGLLDSRVPFWDAADAIKTVSPRTIYTTEDSVTATCPAPPCRVAFDNTNVTASDLALPASPVYTDYPNNGGTVTTVAGLVDAIIAYVRGQDAFDEDNDTDVTEYRDIVLGDIFHSTPRAIAAPTRFHLAEPGFAGFRGDYADRDRVIYVGANDGMLHAFDAGTFNLGDDPSTPELEVQYYTAGNGTERFGYVPGVMQDKMKLVPQNAPRSEFFVDGPLSVADAWLGTGTKTKDEWATVLIAAFREGGTGYLALDITDPDATSGDDHYPYPTLLWEFTDPDLGDSWSEAVITRVKQRDSFGAGDNCGVSTDGDGDCKERWVAIFAGGYEDDGDPNRSSYVAPGDAGWRDVSKAIFMVALDDGSVLAKVEYDASTNPDMQYSIPSAPAVMDVNFDGFADVVYVGDLGGQMWKWDISDVGEDSSSPADGTMDNWPYGVFFETPSTTLTNMEEHYRSFFFPPVGAYVKGKLVLAFGTGERHNLGYEGDTDPGVVEQNRFYVATDPNPIGPNAFSAGTIDETDLTDVTNLDADNVPGDQGYYFTLAESEKFVTEITIFAGYVIVGSYTPDVGADVCSTFGGQSFLHIFNVASGMGFFADPSDPPSEDRRTYVGGGFPTSPEVTVANNPDDDVIIVKTSEGPRLITIDAPPRTDPRGTFIYWRQQD